jgi:L-cysteine S-thiosulfotransferase
MKKNFVTFFAATLVIATLVVGCANTVNTAQTASTPAANAPKAPSDADVVAALKSSFKEAGAAKLDRLNQTELQVACTAASRSGNDLDPKVRESLQAKALASVKYPADGQYLGDWKRGEAIAQSGRGLQFSDSATTAAGGNCYACHQVDKKEIAHGNIGPSLTGYGKLRGNTEPIQKYTWARIWNSHAFNACANMPRFGDAGILTEAQIKDVMALLLDPQSPVNQ